MNDFCFYLNDSFCYKHLRKVDTSKCTFKKCDEYVMASCTGCRFYEEKSCVGNKNKMACVKFMRKAGWALEESYA